MTDSLDRRNFLRIGGGSLLACAAGRVLAQDVSQGAKRVAPAKPIVLKTTELELALDPEQGLPYEYRLPKLQTRFRGDVTSQPMVATVCDKANWKFVPVPLHVQSSRDIPPSNTTADFDFTTKVDDRAAASFTLRYRVEGPSVFVSLYDVREHEGFELIDVAMPALVTVSEEDGAAWLAHGETGGSLTMLSDAKAGNLAPNRFWGKVLATLPVLMVGNGKAACALEIQSFMDGAEMTVSGDAGHRTASMGTIKTHRINGSACWDMNTGHPETTRNCGNRNTPNLLVEAVSNPVHRGQGRGMSCRLDFVGDRNNDGAADWLDAAQLVRERMPAMPSHLYDNAFVYGILLDQPLFEKPTATFEDCERIIRNIAALTDNGRQIVHLWGWQFHGKDSGYPAVNQVDSRVGGYDEMMRLMENAKKYNCTVTLSDNYDDAYRSSVAWNPDWIARRPDGELWESRNWTGENSYILGMAKYVEAAGLERVRYTCERYKLPETTHVDVLSYYPIRNDWDPKHPASGTKNLEARYRVVEEFKKHGVDVSSEALRYSFLGTISSFWYMTGQGADPFGGQPIPLLATIYRKCA
ncbi:MAG: endo-alpha-N-acetylgalactosaminidase family protein, partial [Stellaceae bacterium]